MGLIPKELFEQFEQMLYEALGFDLLY